MGYSFSESGEDSALESVGENSPEHEEKEKEKSKQKTYDSIVVTKSTKKRYLGLLEEIKKEVNASMQHFPDN